MTFEEAWGKFSGIMQLAEEEAQLLYNLAKESPRIVELGTLKGNSGFILGATGNYVATIDNYSASGSSQEEAKELLKVFSTVQVIKMDTAEAGKSWKDKVDFLFIDGGHDYEQVKADIKAWYDKVSGKIAFHDYGSWSGVTQAVDEAIKQGKLKKIDQAGSLIVTEKV